MNRKLLALLMALMLVLVSCTPDPVKPTPTPSVSNSEIPQYNGDAYVAVNNNVPKSYEWDAAFGIVFSLVWLFAEMLQLISNTK